MPAQRQDQQHTGREKQDQEQRNARIGKQVLHTLGQPGDLQRVQVRPLWEGHYRVNVLVGEDAASSKVAYSYFLVADSDGTILACTPEIKREH
jgi:hypothetical protein